MSTVEDEFTSEIVAKFDDDDIGKLYRSDPTIVLICRRRFQRNRGKVDKFMEIRNLSWLRRGCLANWALHCWRIPPVQTYRQKMNFNVLKYMLNK